MGNLCCSTIGATQMKKLDSTSESPEPPSGKSATKPTKGNTSYKQMESGNKSLDIVSSTISISPRTLAKTNAAKDGHNVPAVATPASVGLHVQGSNVDAPDKTIESSEGDALETQSPRRSISQLEHVGKYVVLEELGSGAQATVYKCAIGSEYKKYMNMKYPKKKDKMKAPDHGAPSESNVVASKPTTTCEFFAMKVVKKKSILRRRKRHQELLKSNKTSKKAKEKIGKYGYATGKVAKEIAILKRLQHENIVKVIDVLDNPDEDKLYIVMEYLPSGALLPDWEPNNGDQNCNINPLSEETVRVIYRDIALAMLYMHTHNVVHRDIKPSNILMSRSGVGHGSAKLADFGVAHIFADENENVENLETFINGPMVGTPMFRPPECFTPEGKRSSIQSMDPASIAETDAGNRRLSDLLLQHQSLGDVWSFGVSLYLSVMGRPPFTGQTYEELSHNIQRKPLIFNFENAPVISASLKSFLSKLLDKDASKRPNASEILNDPWISMDGILPNLTLSKKESEKIELEEQEISEALTLVMRTMEVVSFSTRWLMHARREITSRNNDKDKA